MKHQRPIFSTAIAAAVFAAFVGNVVPGFAQEPQQQGPQQQDPPSRVARLNWLEGSVSFQPAGVDTWTNATPNYPLTTGDHIYTDTNSRAEMHVGPNVIRLSQLSNFGFINLDDRTVQMRFTEGALEVRLRNLADDDFYEIDTPQGAITLLRTGDYRIDCDPDRNATMVTVRAGEAEVTANGQAFPVHPRQTAFFAGDHTPDVRDANSPDSFDRYTSDRNRLEERPRPHEYVPPTMVGCEDLYIYGEWRTYPEYGTVWVPPARVGWAPYRYGHWAWVEPWGWTWIDDAPWGFAPFHYGRWAHAEIGWIWVPGPVAVRPVYAPALVAFVGGPHFNLTISIGGGGGVAWFPLGPREIYRPSYHVSNTYVNQVNVTNVTNIRNVNITNVNVTNVRYVNQTVPGAVTAVPQDAFVSRQPVHRVMQPVTAQQAAQAQVVGAAPPVAPQRASLVGTGSSNVPHPREGVMRQQVVTKQQPPPPPVSFQARQQVLTQNPGRPVDPQTMRNLRAQQSRFERPAPAPLRPATTPAPVPAPAPAARTGEAARPMTPRPLAPSNANPQTMAPAPVPQQRPLDRLESRPPSARRPTEPQYQPQVPPQAEPQRVTPQPQQTTPARPREAQAPARPAEQARPAPRPERPAANNPEKREDRRAPRAEEKKEERKEPQKP